MSARNPRRVSSPCSLLGSLASTQRYSHSLGLARTHTRLSALLTLSLTLTHTHTSRPCTNRQGCHSLPILLAFQPSLTQHLFPMQVIRFLLSLFCFFCSPKADKFPNRPELFVDYRGLHATSASFGHLLKHLKLLTACLARVDAATEMECIHLNKSEESTLEHRDKKMLFQSHTRCSLQLTPPPPPLGSSGQPPCSPQENRSRSPSVHLIRDTDWILIPRYMFWSVGETCKLQDPLRFLSYFR